MMFRIRGGIRVSEASEEELELFRGDLPDAEPAAVLSDWRLLAFRRPSGRFQIMACGYDDAADGIWIVTAPVLRLERLIRVRTRPDTTYVLGVRHLTHDVHLADRVRQALYERGRL